MQLTSNIFICAFLPAVLLLYYIVPERFKNGVLFLGSLVFYAWGEPLYVLLLLFVIVWNYAGGLLIVKSGNRRQARKRLIWTVAVDVLLLVLFGYAGFLLDSMGALTGAEIHYLRLPVPLGISVYMLRVISYVADVYKGEAKIQKSLLNFGVYTAIFPLLPAGPVVTYKEMDFSLEERKVSLPVLGKGAVIFAGGLAKKVILAEAANEIFQSVMALETGRISVLTAWLGCLAFAFGIYFMFSGYWDMAAGLGNMFGFDFPKNFDTPYASGSMTEFFTRWNRSLSVWLREYVPCHPLLTGILAGLWYGAGWSFALWGLYLGILLTMERFGLLKLLRSLPRAVRRIYTVFFALTGWVLFFCEDVRQAAAYYGLLFGAGAKKAADGQALYLLASNAVYWIVFLLAVLLPASGVCMRFWRQIRRRKAHIVYGLSAAFVLLVIVFGVNPSFRANAELLIGKWESNDIFKGKNHYLIEKVNVEDEAAVDKNVSALQAFRKKYPELPVSMILVPSAANVLSEKLPPFAVTEDQSSQFLEIREALKNDVTWIDAERVLKKYREEEIYYHTDPHWTTLGAYYVYQEMMTVLGRKEEMVTFQVYPVSEEYSGSLSERSGYEKNFKDTITVYIPKEVSKDVVVYDEETEKKTASLYDTGKLKTKNKYDLFQGGNHGLLDIRTKSESEERLLVLKDSYANSFLPFLAPYYREIVVADPEYYKGDVSELIQEKNITGVLVLYSGNKFVKDTKLSGVLADE